MCIRALIFQRSLPGRAKWRKKIKLYLKTTTDDLELPVAVAGSAEELARMLHTTKGSVKSAISHHYAGWHKVIVEEDWNEEEN